MRLVRRLENCVLTSSTPRKPSGWSRDSKERWKTSKNTGRKRRFLEDSMSKSIRLVGLRKCNMKSICPHKTWRGILSVLRHKSNHSLAVVVIKKKYTQLTITISRRVIVYHLAGKDKLGASAIYRVLMIFKSGVDLKMHMMNHPEGSLINQDRGAMIMSIIEWNP